MLDVQEIPFDSVNGNCLGFARDRFIAINPVNPFPLKTTFHEVAHVLNVLPEVGTRGGRIEVAVDDLELNGNIRVEDVKVANYEILNSPRIPIASVVLTRQLKQEEATAAPAAGAAPSAAPAAAAGAKAATPAPAAATKK